MAHEEAEISNVAVSKPRRRHWRRLGLRLLVVLPIAVILYGVHWWYSPRPLHLITQISNCDQTLLSCTSGFVVQEGDYRFVLYNWHGKVKQLFTILHPPYRNNAIFIPSISANGRFFTVAAMNCFRGYVYCWQDGKSFGMPVMVSGRITSFRSLDDGRVFIETDDKRGYFIRGCHIVAQGRLPVSGTIAPDGSSLFSFDTLQFAHIQVVEDRIATISVQHMQSIPPVLLPQSNYREDALSINGRMLSYDGELYGQHGLIGKPSGWECTTLTADGRYTLQFQYSDNQARIYSPVNGQVWPLQIPQNTSVSDGIASQDGSHAMLMCSTIQPTAVQRLYTKIPILREWMSGSSYQRHYIDIYARSGKRFATLNIDPLLRQMRSKSGAISPLYQYTISPDGRALVLVYWKWSVEHWICVCKVYRR